MAARLKEYYSKEVVPALKNKFQYKSVMQVPKVEKVIVNIGVGEAIKNAKALEGAVADLTLITGQKPIVTRAKKSISGFKLRAGMSVGCKLTLRGERLYHFLDKLFNVALPRVRDFRGLSRKAFDGRGNYSLGLREQLVFPEISYDKVDKIRGMNICLITTAKNDEESLELLTLLGMPFKK
ncbi:MAG: hypothetical protein RLZ12_684 [Bacillota bacterium]